MDTGCCCSCLNFRAKTTTNPRNAMRHQYRIFQMSLQTVGCDGAVDSRAKADRCGVCNGDGSSCSGGGNQGNRPKPGKRPKPSKRPTASGQVKKFTYDKTPGYGGK